jgi:NAD(P)-dependent dehydrogenase (short-subunit alcohol dehydrogenase family)
VDVPRNENPPTPLVIDNTPLIPYNENMKKVLITGIGRGIGKALAEKFLKEGFFVVGTVLTSQKPEDKENLKVYQLDLASPESIDHCCADIQRDGYIFDILINNAGALFDDDETHLLVDKLRKTLEVNLIGTIDFTEHIIPLINKGGHIVSITSAAGSLLDMDNVESSHFPYHYPAYKISKCAMNMYVRTLATLLKHEGTNITVSAVHPGWVKTDMGGGDATITPEEAANDIFKLALSRPETGQFWFKGEHCPW